VIVAFTQATGAAFDPFSLEKQFLVAAVGNYLISSYTKIICFGNRLFQEVKYLAGTYTSNQAGALATALAGALWGLTALGAAIVMARQTATALTIFAILVAIAWILVPLIAKRIRWAYIVGIIVIVISLVGLLAMPGTPAWYAFISPVFNFSFVVFYLVMLGGIYFSYKSYLELKTA